MERPAISVLTIGQTPRPDLTDSLDALAADCDVIVRGALDDIRTTEIPECDPAEYPLETQLRDGTRVVIAAEWVESRLQALLDRTDERTIAHLVLCAGPFPTLTSESLLVKPFENGVDVFSSKGFTRLMVIVPFADQVEPARRKWTHEAFAVDLLSMDERPNETELVDWIVRQPALPNSDAVVFDYVGYSKDVIEHLSGKIQHPVFELGHLATASLVDVLAESRDLLNE